MNKVILVILMLFSTCAFAQVRDYKADSIRLENIDNTLKAYGRQNVVTDKITLVSIIIVIVGTAADMKTSHMLVATSLCSLTILGISWRADLRLSKHKSKTH